MQTKKCMKSWYGNEAILKGKCPKCKGEAFIIEGKYQCCGLSAEVPEKITEKRESTTRYRRGGVPKHIKKEITAAQNNKCIYCGNDLNGWYWDVNKCRYIKYVTHFDHFLPWSSRQDDHKSNLYATCSLCNLIKYSKIFKDIEEAKAHILPRRKQWLGKGIKEEI